MAGIRRVGESRLRLATIALAVVAVMAALSVSTASASNPARGEYHLQALRSQAPGGGKPSGDSVGSSHSSSALPVLLAAFVAVGAGGVAFVYFRRRRSEAHS